MKYSDKKSEVNEAISRSPHGERGLKYQGYTYEDLASYRRSPHGERGLKYAQPPGLARCGSSLPTRGAWIEIFNANIVIADEMVAPHTGSVD